ILVRRLLAHAYSSESAKTRELQSRGESAVSIAARRFRDRNAGRLRSVLRREHGLARKRSRTSRRFPRTRGHVRLIIRFVDRKYGEALAHAYTEQLFQRTS